MPTPKQHEQLDLFRDMLALANNKLREILNRTSHVEMDFETYVGMITGAAINGRRNLEAEIDRRNEAL